MKTYRIATIPGDGIGKEVVPAGRKVLDALAETSSSFSFEFENFDWGGDYFREHGVMMPEDGLNALKDKDAILFGSAGDPHIPDHITLWGLRLKICQGFDQYANVRPTRILPGIDGPLKRCRPGRPELGHRARELRRRVRRHRRQGPPGPPDRGGDGRVDDDARRRRAHHAFRVPSRTVEATQAADRDHEEQRAAPRDGDVGRDRARDLARVPRRHLGQGTRRRVDRSHDQPSGVARHDRRDQPARRHPERPRGGAGRQPRHRADRQHRSGAALSRRCSSRSTVRHSTSWARALRTRSARSGP